MTKADLKTGMRVQYRNKFEGLKVVMLNTEYGDILESFKNAYVPLNKYDHKLNYKGDNEWDIVKIYGEYPKGDLIDKNGTGELLWTRHEPEAMIDLDEMGEVSKSTIKEVLKRNFNREA